MGRVHLQLLKNGQGAAPSLKYLRENYSVYIYHVHAINIRKTVEMRSISMTKLNDD